MIPSAHLWIVLFFGLLFGFAIDVDHGLYTQNIRCVLSIDEKGCVHTQGLRGFMHSRKVWVLFGVIPTVFWTLHLMADGLLPIPLIGVYLK